MDHLFLQWLNYKQVFTYTNGDVTMKVQELLDGVMPSLLPVAAVALIYYFYE